MVTVDGNTYGLWHQFLDAFGLIALPDHSNVFAVGYSLFNMVGQIITLLGVIFLSGYLSNIFGKRNVFIVCLALTAVFTSLFFVVDAKSVGLIFVINMLKSMAYAPTIPLLWAMMGDVADHSERKEVRTISSSEDARARVLEQLRSIVKADATDVQAIEADADSLLAELETHRGATPQDGEQESHEKLGIS